MLLQLLIGLAGLVLFVVVVFVLFAVRFSKAERHFIDLTTKIDEMSKSCRKLEEWKENINVLPKDISINCKNEDGTNIKLIVKNGEVKYILTQGNCKIKGNTIEELWKEIDWLCEQAIIHYYSYFGNFGKFDPELKSIMNKVLATRQKLNLKKLR